MNLQNVESLKPTGLFTNYIYKAIPLVFDESMSYYETLLGLLAYLKNTVIPTVNNNADAVAELQNLYTQLHDYVENYFNNLDVQQEINNKLDQMVEDGTLQEIISNYLNSKAIFGFDNVESMKNATNLINGSYAQTLGFYQKNDGGKSLYKIRTIKNDDIIDDMTIIQINNNNNNLIAELIIENQTINSIQVGCKINNENFNNGIILNNILNYCNNHQYNFIFLPGKYYINTPIVINEKLFSIIITGMENNANNGTLLIYNGTGYCITLAQGGLRYTIQNISIKCNNNNNGINCDGYSNSIINFKNHLKNITITSAIIGMRVVSSTYTFIDNFTFGGSSNTEIGLLIEGYEFTYINNSSIDGYSNTNENSIALKILGGTYYYINNIDLCNFGKGKAIYMTSSTFDLYNLFFNNINVIRCDGGIYTEAIDKSINSINFDNIIISLSGNNENSHYFYSYSNDNYLIQNFKINNLSIRNLSSNLIPDFIYEHNKGNYGLFLNIKELYLCSLEKSGIKGSTTDQYTYINNTISNQKLVYLQADGIKTQYTFSLTYPKITNSPFITLSIINHNDFKILNTEYDNENHKLNTTIIFDSPPSGNLGIFSNISYNGKNI